MLQPDLSIIIFKNIIIYVLAFMQKLNVVTIVKLNFLVA